MIRPILQLGDRTLRKKSLPIKDFNSESLRQLIKDLSDTLHDARKRFAYGLGIAPPQIGELERVVFIDTPVFKSALLNPEITWVSDATFEVWDSCFSFNLAFFVLVSRNCSIKVDYFDLKGNRQSLNAEADLSELLQHEMDHLNGILATDRMENKKAIMMRSEWEKVFRSIK
jgi:peptide deformylase